MECFFFVIFTYLTRRIVAEMNTLSHKIALTINKYNPENTSSIEVMQYALNIIMNTLLILIISLLVGLFTGQLIETSLVLLSFSTLRFFSGGAHLKTALTCNIFSIILCTAIPHLVFLVKDLFWIVNGISLILMLLFAPNPDINAQIPSKRYPVMKLISILLVFSNFFIYSSVIGLAFMAQSLTVIPLKRRSLL
ncbi:hypothetical protein GJB61_11050 [Paenibacillus sp. LC-T2]|uniref:Accessory regulator AgrB n=2 Tax=Paenibacillus monticola TaxID=2666075 RepID=A0A7X2H4S2_9BACL|nr:hypothetical protein [Paenibacillus monticola]